jgi:hypothetical protein
VRDWGIGLVAFPLLLAFGVFASGVLLLLVPLLCLAAEGFIGMLGVSYEMGRMARAAAASERAPSRR